MTGIARFDEAPAASEQWVARLQKQLGWQDRSMAYTALVATLHALRDYLPAEEAVSLGAGLPVLLRGLYYEGWHPHDKPMPLENREAFLLRLHEALHREVGIDPEPVARTVLELLSAHVKASELEEIRAACPPALHGLWPD